MNLSVSKSIICLSLLAFLPTNSLAQDPGVIKLLDKIQALESRVAALESKVQNISANPQNDEQEISEFREIATLISSEKFEEAKPKLDSYISKYPNSQRLASAKKYQQEVAVFGKPAPSNWEMEKWFQGEKDIDLTSNKATLIVFWEVWCPHCRNEVPKIESVYSELKSKGLQVIGLTKLSRGSTETQVSDFIKEQKLSYPIAKENGSLSRYFAVSGVPAAAVIKDGKVVWRGHPARLGKDKLEGWLG